jgi:hypothetical protein
MQFLFRTSSFTAAHGDDLEHPTQELATTFQAAIRKPATKNLIDDPTQPPIGTSSITTRSSGLAITEIRTIKAGE